MWSNEGRGNRHGDGRDFSTRRKPGAQPGKAVLAIIFLREDLPRHAGGVVDQETLQARVVSQGPKKRERNGRPDGVEADLLQSLDLEQGSQVRGSRAQQMK